jgi:flagella basal body P-ring formation protein FlgA
MPILQGLPPSTRWDLQFATPLQHGTINANLVVRAPNQSPRAHWISIQVARFQKVPVAVRVIPMGESFQKNDIRYEWRDLTHATQSIPDEEELVGSLAKMGVPLNAVIFRNYLARVQAVNRGEMVKVVSGGEQWNVSLSAVAQQSGYVGDVIKLSNSNSQRVISGQVIARGVVRVE